MKLIENFFKYNLEVKKILFECQPPISEASSLNEDKYVVDYVITQYSDKLLEAIKDIKFYIFRMLDMTGLFVDDREYVADLFKIYEEKIINCGYNFGRLRNIYKVIFSDMRDELVKEVGTNCYGYGATNCLRLTSAQSINELLHIIHWTVCNNEFLYGIMPKLGEKVNDDNYLIRFYGDNYDLAKEIFDKFPVEMSCGNTDILGLKKSNKVLMMVRDRGHALSIEIDEDTDDRVYVHYFIPKICDKEMVNRLKGVTKVTDQSEYTVGVFSTSKDLAAMEIIDFISKVPIMDKDMIFDPRYSRYFR